MQQTNQQAPPHILQFSNNSTVTLNEEQFRVVTSPQSENQRILASAGSGKTTTITARIAYLIEHYNVSPNRILLVTFSRAAAQEMHARLIRLIGPQPIHVGTFHSLSLHILRTHAPTTLRDQPFIDELPHRLTDWLQTDKGRKWVTTLSAIIVDEFQDINAIQWLLLTLLHHRYASMTIVGDDAQNIYTWRGSSVDYILNFHNRVPRTTDYQLCRNYRSTAAIVSVANSIMRFIPTLPYKQKMVAITQSGPRPQVHFFYRASEEYEWITRNIDTEYRTQTTSTFAVLARNNYDLYKIEEYLHKRALPYTLLTSYSPNERHQITRRITLSTIHASKGLEWDTVYFMNLHDDTFPSRKTDEDIISERRLFYVGVTRARTSLLFTYSRHERALSRFVREIPRPFLTFHNIASYQLLPDQQHTSYPSVADIVASLDGDDWHSLRRSGALPDFIAPTSQETIYRFAELFSVPEFVKNLDIRDTWFKLIDWIFLRELACQTDAMQSLRTAEVDTTLLTLRIYKEDYAFWLEYEAEFEHLVHHFLPHSPRLPAIEYADLVCYVQTKFPYLVQGPWTTKHLVQASVIISKIRGQLRPLRHAGYDLSEFRFGCTRNSVPTESRPFVLASWHAVSASQPYASTQDLLPDLWYLAALSSVAEGRNIPLYQKAEVTPFLLTGRMPEISEAIVTAVQRWIPSLSSPALSVDCVPEQSIKPFTFQLLTDTTAFATYFDPVAEPSADDKIVLLLKVFLYNQKHTQPLSQMAFINLATGLIRYYSLTPQIFEQASIIWKKGRSKLEL